MNLNEITATAAENVYRDYQGGYFKTLISPVQTDGAFALIEMVLPNGSEPPMHMHAHEDETFYIMEGKMHFDIDGIVKEAGPGEAVFAPRMVPHAFKIIGQEAKFITLITPGKFWGFFMEFSTPNLGERVVRPLQGPPAPEVITRLVDRMTNVYGISLFPQSREA